MPNKESYSTFILSSTSRTNSLNLFFLSRSLSTLFCPLSYPSHSSHFFAPLSHPSLPTLFPHSHPYFLNLSTHNITPIFPNTLFSHSLTPLAPPFPNPTFTFLSVSFILFRLLIYTTFSTQLSPLFLSPTP